MSSLTRCNYCTLRAIQARANRDGMVVTVRPGGIGVDVFVHAEGETVPDRTDDGEPPDGFAGSFMGLSNGCACAC